MREFEKQIVEIMIEADCTFREALMVVFEMNEVDYNSVFDLVDFLEDQIIDLDTVAYYMNIWTGESNDLILKANK